jgi:hypothetical protein
VALIEQAPATGRDCQRQRGFRDRFSLIDGLDELVGTERLVRGFMRGRCDTRRIAVLVFVRSWSRVADHMGRAAKVILLVAFHAEPQLNLKSIASVSHKE